VSDEAYKLRCPHCGKTFRAEVLTGTPEQRGFKCPHCKLLVSFDRADVRGKSG
jgi:uncharacterized C2H2 Zn-finger protein